MVKPRETPLSASLGLAPAPSPLCLWPAATGADRQGRQAAPPCICSLFVLYVRTKPRRKIPHGRHRLCPPRHSEADRLCAVACPEKLDAPALGSPAGSPLAQRLDRRASQDEAAFRFRPPAVLQAGGLCRTPRPHQAPRRPGRLLPRQGAHVEVDRREPVSTAPAGDALAIIQSFAMS